MKLFGKFHEMSLNEINLYRASSYHIKELIQDYPFTARVKEYKPKKGTQLRTHQETRYTPAGKQTAWVETEQVTYHPDFSKRHQVVLTNDMKILKISIYSVPLDTKEVRDYLGLKPIPEVTKKEKLEQTLAKMDSKTGAERGFHVEKVVIDKKKVKKK